MTHELILNKQSSSKISFLPKLYVWSILLHPLLFFYVAHEELIGIGGNISKFLELIVILCVFISLISNSKYTIRLPSKYYSIYWIYILYSIIVGLFGYLYGYYQFEYVDDQLNQGFFSSTSVRPIFEYIVSIFYFFYFVVLAFHFLSNDKIIDYFFKVFFFLFFSNLILGFIDVISTVFFQTNIIPVSLIRDTSTNYRFHGLSGEPRDAFVYLIFGIAMFYLYDAWKMQKKRKLIVVTFSIIAIVLTVSVSGIIGLIISAFLFFIYALATLKLKNIFLVFVAIIFLALIIYLNVIFFERYEKYLSAIPALYRGLVSGNYVEGIFLGQLPNIWPLFSRFLEVLDLNIFPTLFGTGIGTESVVNVNMISGADMVLNPHAQVIRLFYSAGIVGSIIYLMAFFYPVYKTSKRYNSKIFIYFTLLLLGVTLGHRSIVMFLFLGAFSAIFYQLSKKSNFKRN